MSLILSKQSGRGRAVLTKLPNPEAGVELLPHGGINWNYSPKVEDIHLTGT